MTESEIERKLVVGIRQVGGVAYKFVSPGNVGVPDRLICLPEGRVIFIELKTETGRLSAIQKVQIKRLRDLGHDVRVLYGLRQVRDFLREVKTE